MKRQAAARVTAVVVSYQSAHALPECLRALSEAGVAAIVVDNASDDGSAALAQRLGARVLANARNEGFGRAANIGASGVETPYALILNPDAILAPRAIDALLDAALRYPDAVLLAPHIRSPAGKTVFNHGSTLAPMLNTGPRTPPDGDCCVSGASGAAMMLRMDALRFIGGFDPELFLYYEDDDLTRRLIDAGGALVHVHDAIVTHAHGKSSAPARGAEYRKRWHLAWSRCYVLAKFGEKVPAAALMGENALRLALAAFMLRRRRVEIHAGQLAGAAAWLAGRTALQRQRLRLEAGQVFSRSVSAAPWPPASRL